MATPVAPKSGSWIAKLGWAAFVFFLVKGLAWLTVPAVLAWWSWR